MPDRTGISDQDVFLVVDLQNDFCPGGKLAVPRGDEIVPLVNRLAARFKHVILTQDWHPAGHLSFASSHAGKKPYDTVQAPYGTQELWPDHCVQGTTGAELRKDLQIAHAELVLRKGYHREIDSYSAFYENDRETHTGLRVSARTRVYPRVHCRARVRFLRPLFGRRRAARRFRPGCDRRCLPRHRCGGLNGEGAPGPGRTQRRLHAG